MADEMVGIDLGIDPGKSGGLVWRGRGSDKTEAAKMPEGMTGIVDFLKSLHAERKILSAYMENVGFHREGNSASSSATFARHCGWLESALYLLGIPVVKVNPQKWQSWLGAMPKESAARKKKIKEIMQTRHTDLKLTLYISDAIGILDYGLHVSRGVVKP